MSMGRPHKTETFALKMIIFPTMSDRVPFGESQRTIIFHIIFLYEGP